MKHLRKSALARWSNTALTLVAAWGVASAATFPDHPIKMVVGFPAGQSTDTSARRIAQGMADILKQSVFVDNKPGAAGGISHGAVKTAAPDGYTVVMGSTGTLAINPWLYSKLPYDPIKDFDPVALVSASPLVLFVPASSPVNNLKELIAYAKARPGKVTYGSGGSGTTGHIAMEMLKKEAGIDMLHVPYKGSPPMITDLIGGQIDVAFEPIGSVLPFEKSARVKFLGFATLKRYAAAPKVPTLSEQGLPGFEAVPWTAILVPKGTPPSVIQQLNQAINQVLKKPELVEAFAQTGSYPVGGSPSDAKTYLMEENAKWGKAVKASGAQVD
ncbi:tripartite tricarboxylate transporter substrate binding protein [Variovorax sp. LG9.2]|uniref:Bug family tripartite tricarboxylate transporter substrate binding protein n=1 Tax=Variovorax sp. LG9.2 TaxID=3048626 RepID=UPI002B234561|nr:tripartite tricarboxylate transporter substrate binding protein [Variovorax sp. LG9.2]MEB0060125.1 tripartite tricarboxylate transporter substrate binding protein [Variovorax sp. LG9.2]